MSTSKENKKYVGKFYFVTYANEKGITNGVLKDEHPFENMLDKLISFTEISKEEYEMFNEKTT